VSAADWMSPSEAVDMLFLDPDGPMENFSFGILRRELRGKPNDLVAFAQAKLQPVRPTVVPDDADWPVTAAAWSLLLAPGVPDEQARPAILFPRYRDELLEREKAMLVTVTLRFPDTGFRHEMMEEARSFAVDRLVRARRLSTLVVLHVPGAAGSANMPHVHLVALAREHHGWGFGPYVRPVTSRGAQTLLFEEWQAHRENWRTPSP
jgi:hypothetical protein